MPKYFDIHSHLNDRQFRSDISEVVGRMREQGVWTITVGADKKMSKDACEIAQMDEGLFACIGTHPTDNVNEVFDRIFFEQLLEEYGEKIVAIGECGLEYFRLKEETAQQEKQRQKELFEAHIDFAAEVKKPLMIHCRDAHDDVLDILRTKKREYGDALSGNVHFFSGDVDTAKKYFELDFTISFTGVITFAKQYDDVIAYAPLTHIMSETDSPYVAPVPHRGERCEPVYVQEVVKRMSQIRNEDEGEISQQLIKNAFRVFKIPLH